MSDIKDTLESLRTQIQTEIETEALRHYTRGVQSGCRLAMKAMLLAQGLNIQPHGGLWLGKSAHKEVFTDEEILEKLGSRISDLINEELEKTADE